MDDKYKQFLSFNFDSNEAWKAYYNSIDPKPENPTQLLALKKRFYKRKIDTEFDTAYQPPREIFDNLNNGSSTGTSSNQQQSSHSYENRSNQQSQNQQNTQNNSNQNANGNPQNDKMLFYAYIAETSLYLYFLFMCIASSSSPFSYALFAFIIRIARLNWPVQFSKDYLSRLLPQDVFSFLFYALIMLFASNKVFIYLFPTCITAIIYICGFQRRNSQLIPAIISKYIDKIRSYQDKMVKMRSTLEILILPITVVGIFVGFNSFFLPIGYFQFLKMKLSVDNKLTSSLNEIQVMLNNYANTSSNQIIKTVLSKLVLACDYLKR